MLITEKKSPVVEKTEELCRTLVEQASFREILGSIDAFMRDAEAQMLYQDIVDKQELLQGKQRRGVELTDQEIEDFEKGKEALFANPVASAYVDAQRQMHKVQDTISRYVSKTFELGRVPAEDELRSGGGCCGGGGGGGGCGCHG